MRAAAWHSPDQHIAPQASLLVGAGGWKVASQADTPLTLACIANIMTPFAMSLLCLSGFVQITPLSAQLRYHHGQAAWQTM